MKLSKIFKMELYKNSTDKPYLIIIGVLAILAAIFTFWILNYEGSGPGADDFFFIPLPVLLLVPITSVGAIIMALVYPFHLLNIDYKNKVISLMFASGVPRVKYYFVKIGATILTCLCALFIIAFIPMVQLLIFHQEHFISFMQDIVYTFTADDVVPFVLSNILAIIASLVTLTTAVIMTKGRLLGLFIFIAFDFIMNTVETLIFFTIRGDIYSLMFAGSYHHVQMIFSVLQLILFGIIGILVLKKQDL